MRIISKFHDYYDSIQAYGQDRSITFLRKEQILEVKSKEEEFFLKHAISSSGDPFKYYYRSKTFRGEYIGFCNKWIPVVVREFNVKNGPYDQFGTDHVEYIYDLKRAKDVYPEESNLKLKGKSYSLDEFFAQKPGNKYYEIFLKDKLCYFHYGWSHEKQATVFTINPNLSKMQFYRHKDPFSCFQEIAQFISGVLGGSSPAMHQLNNEERIVKAGFNKWSFRRLPQ